MCDKQKVSLQDLILSAICYLQEKNGVTACEIAEYVAKKRGCKLSQIEGMIELILCKAKNMEILWEKKGLFRINQRYDNVPGKEDNNNSNDNHNIAISEDDSEDDEDCDKEDEENDLCVCLKLSRDYITDDESNDERCPLNKKRKCG